MIQVERSVEIAAPAEEVFDVVTDLSTHPRWRPAVREFRTADGEPPSVGSQIVEVVRFAGRDVHMRYRVTEVEPPDTFAADYVAGPIEVAIRFDLSPSGQGTLAVFSCETERPRIAKVIPFPFFGPLMGRYMSEELGNLKRLVETGRV